MISDTYESMHPKNQYSKDWKGPVRGYHQPHRVPSRAPNDKFECTYCGCRNAGDIEGVVSTMTPAFWEVKVGTTVDKLWFCHGSCCFLYKEGVRA